MPALLDQVGKVDDAVARVLTSGLTFTENFQAELKEIEFYAPVPVWRSLTLAAGWTSSGGHSHGYRINRNGRVYVRGSCAAAAASPDDVITTLPAGFRPNAYEILPVADGSPGVGCIIVDEGGAIRYESGDYTSFSLFGISFDADSPALQDPPTWTPGPPEIRTGLSKVSGVIPVSCRCLDATTNALGGAPSIEWEQATNGVIRIRNVEGLTALRRYVMKLLLFAG